MKKAIKYLDFIIYWCVILIPFSISIASAPSNVFMGLLIFSFLAKKALKRERIFIRTAIDIPLFFFFVVTCLSIFNSVNLKDSLKGGIFRLAEYAIVFFILAGELKDKIHIKRIVFSAALGLILTSVDEIWQVFSGSDFIRGYSPVINIGLVRATASFKDSNTLGIYLSALAPLILGLALYYFKHKEKIAMLFVSVLSLLAIVLTYSRPTLLAIYIALFFFGLIKKDKILTGFLIMLTLASPFILPRTVKDWAGEVDYNPLRFMCNDDRIAAYRNSINMIKAHPVMGLGANTYMKNYKKYKEAPEYRGVVTSDYLYAHNNFLHMAAEIGLLGLAIFIWLLYKLFRECADIYRKLPEGFFKVTCLSLIAALIVFLVNGLTESSLYSSRVAILFWYIAGVALSLRKFKYADKS